MGSKKWTKEQIEQLNNQYGKVSIKELAQEIGRSVGAIRTKASDLGLSTRQGLWTKEDIQFLQENYLELGAKEAAKRLNRTVSAVHAKILEVGGGRKSIGPKVEWTQGELDYLKENYQTQSDTQISVHLGRTEMAVQVRASMLGLQKYIEPFPFFENWTEESAYVVGFFAADGWVSKRGPESIRIAFGQKEPDIIYKLKEVIGSGRVAKKSNGMYRFWIQSVKVYEWLCKLFGHDVCRKSHILQWPSIPDGFIKYFIRGATDGDGSLFKTQDGLWSYCYATSSKDFMDTMVDVIEKRTGVRLSVGLNKIGVWHSRVTGIGAVCLADWLYRDANIALERKSWIAREMMETRGLAHKENVTPKMYEMFPHILNEYEIV